MTDNHNDLVELTENDFCPHKGAHPEFLAHPVPLMPLATPEAESPEASDDDAGGDPQHREKELQQGAAQAVSKANYYVNVATNIPRDQWEKIADAKDAIHVEWDKLRKAKTWREDLVEEYDDVVRRCRKLGKIVHFGRLHDICVEKHPELPANQRKYKGRVVLEVTTSETMKAAGIIQRWWKWSFFYLCFETP